MITRARPIVLLTLLAALAAPARTQPASPGVDSDSSLKTVPGTTIDIGPAERPWRLGTVIERRAAFAAWWTDGYSLRLPGSGLSGPFGDPPLVFVDGLAMPVAVFGRVHADALPVSTFDVESMSLTPGLEILPGLPAGHGALRITTARPGGTTLRGSVVLVNDTGDPGPDLYRSGGRNVDRSGPRASVRASVAEGPWFAEGGFDADEHHMTDSRIIRRIRSVYDEPVPPVIRVLHPHGRVRYDAGGTLIDVRLGRMTADDFHFIDVLSTEWPNRQSWSYVSARAVRAPAGDWTAEISANGRDLDIESRHTRYPGPERVTLRSGAAQATLRRTWPTGTTSLHAGLMTEDAEQRNRFDRVAETRGFAGLGHERRLLATPAVGVTLDLNARVAHPVDSMLDPAHASTAASADVEVRTDPAVMDAGVSLQSDDRPPLSSWSQLTAAGFDAAGLDFSIRPAPFRTRERTVQAYVRILNRTRAGTSRRLEFRVRQSQGLTVPDVEIGHLPDGIRFAPSGAYSAGVEGRAWQIGGGVDWRPIPSGPARTVERPSGLTIRVAAFARGVLTGSERYRVWMSGLPPYTASARVDWRGHRFGADLSARLEGARTWRMYVPAETADRPVQTRVDASVWKRLAGDAALLTIGIRNLLDTPYRIHPAGIDEQLSVRAGLTIRFTHARQP